MPVIRGALGSAVPNTIVPNGARSIRGTVSSAGGADSSVARPVARHGMPSSRGGVLLGFRGLAPPVDTVQYHIYTNSFGNNPIDYGSPVATVSATTWTAGTLAGPGTWRFGVRAFNGSGEEQNLDCAIAIVLDAYGNDVTNIPLPPTGLRAFATSGGGIRVEWWYPATANATVPTGFYVYLGTGMTPDYSTPTATVPYSAGIFNTFQSNLVSLSDGTTYAIGVRAFNASGEEQNTTVVTVTADATGPAAVDSLTATAIV